MSGFLHRDEVTPIPKTPRAPKTRRGLPTVSSKRRRAERDLAAAKVEVRARSLGRCEAWIWPHACTIVATEYHHVVRRSQGGANTPANLLHLCLHAHHEIHAHPDLARRHGLLGGAS